MWRYLLVCAAFVTASEDIMGDGSETAGMLQTRGQNQKKKHQEELELDLPPLLVKAMHEPEALLAAAVSIGLPWDLQDATRSSEQLKHRVRLGMIQNDARLVADKGGAMGSIAAACKDAAEKGHKTCESAAADSSQLFVDLALGKGGDWKTAAAGTITLGVTMYCPMCGMVAGTFASSILGGLFPDDDGPTLDEKLADLEKGQKELKQAMKKLALDLMDNSAMQIAQSEASNLRVEMRELASQVEWVPGMLAVVSENPSESDLNLLLSFNLMTLQSANLLSAKLRHRHDDKWVYAMSAVANALMNFQIDLLAQIQHHDKRFEPHIARQELELLALGDDSWASWHAKVQGRKDQIIADQLHMIRGWNEWVEPEKTCTCDTWRSGAVMCTCYRYREGDQKILWGTASAAAMAGGCHTMESHERRTAKTGGHNVVEKRHWLLQENDREVDEPGEMDDAAVEVEVDEFEEKDVDGGTLCRRFIHADNPGNYSHLRASLKAACTSSDYAERFCDLLTLELFAGTNDTDPVDVALVCLEVSPLIEVHMAHVDFEGLLAARASGHLKMQEVVADVDDVKGVGEVSLLEKALLGKPSPPSRRRMQKSCSCQNWKDAEAFYEANDFCLRAHYKKIESILRRQFASLDFMKKTLDLVI